MDLKEKILEKVKLKDCCVYDLLVDGDYEELSGVLWKMVLDGVLYITPEYKIGIKKESK